VLPTLTSTVEDGMVRFRLADPGHGLSAVRLWHDLDLPPHDRSLTRVEGGWELAVPIPPADRWEYLFEVCGATPDGEHTACLLDPGNPRQVPGAFGPHSWLPLPGYREPTWLGLEPVASHRLDVAVTDTPVGAVDVPVWSPSDATPDEPLPVLFAHDGPEMDALAGLSRFVGVMVGNGRLPRMRLVLLAPGERNARYAANPRYAAALAEHVVPGVLRARPTDRPPVLIGPSLGALAALHVEWTWPGTFGGLWLGSGSFFTAETDPQERGFPYWDRVTGFVDSVLGAGAAPTRARVVLGCGSVEENRHNNRVMARQLAGLGMDVTTAWVGDGHCFTCWRDLLDPSLVDLLNRAWCLDVDGKG
jgi:enterochelin esterase family protein